jgi:hypothetical protein
VFGNSPWVIRLPALLAGVLLIPASYAAVQTVYDRRSALAAAGFVACSTNMVDFSTNARGYTLLALLTAIAVVLADYVLRRTSIAAWALLTLSCALAFYTIPTMVCAFAMLVTWMTALILHGYPGSLWLRQFLFMTAFVVGVVLLTVLLYQPVIQTSGLESLTANRYLIRLPLLQFIANLPDMFAGAWTFINLSIPRPLAALLLVGYLACVILELLKRNWSSFTLTGLLGLCAVLVTQRVIPLPRIFLFYSPFYFGAACWGLFALGAEVSRIAPVSSRAIRPAAVATGAAVLVYLASNVIGWMHRDATPGTFRAVEKVVAYLAPRLRHGDAIAASVPSSGPLQYYMNRAGITTRYLLPDPTGVLNFYAKRGAPVMQDRTCWDRVYAIVNLHAGQKPEDLDSLARIPPHAKVNRRLLQSYEGSALYEVDASDPDSGYRSGFHPTDASFLFNAGFESGPSCWSDWGNSAVEASAPHAGARALRVGTGPGGRMQEFVPEPGVHYTMAVWARLEGSSTTGPNAWVGLDYKTAGGKDVKVQTEVTGPSYRKYTIEFDSPPDVKTAWVWSWKQPGATTLYVDDYQLTRTKPGTTSSRR